MSYTHEELKNIKLKITEEIAATADVMNNKVLTKPTSPENALGRVSRMYAINNKNVNEASLI